MRQSHRPLLQAAAPHPGDDCDNDDHDVGGVDDDDGDGDHGGDDNGHDVGVLMMIMVIMLMMLNLPGQSQMSVCPQWCPPLNVYLLMNNK